MILIQMLKSLHVFIFFLGNLHLSTGNSALHLLVTKSDGEEKIVFKQVGYFCCALEEVNRYPGFLDCAYSIQDKRTASVCQRITVAWALGNKRCGRVRAKYEDNGIKYREYRAFSPLVLYWVRI